MSKEQLVAGVIRNTQELATDTKPLFRDRADAGIQLATQLATQKYTNPILFAIPKGGIPVAMPVREMLDSPLFLAFGAKIPLSLDDTRFGLGAITNEGALFNDDLLEMLDLEPNHPIITNGVQHATCVLKKNMLEMGIDDEIFPSKLHGKTAIIVDDGVSTGYTAAAVASHLAHLKPVKIVIATPIGSQAASDTLQTKGFEVVMTHCIGKPGFIVDTFYESFPNVSAQEIHDLMQSS